MLLSIPAAQFYGGLIESLAWLLVGIWLALIRPRRIRARVARGELSEAEAQAKERKIHPSLGYAALVLGITQTYVVMGQVGFFGSFDVAVGLLTLAAMLAVIVVAVRRRRKTKQSP